MPNITTRVSGAQDATLKGAPLTNAEIDQNFININNAVIATGDLTGFVDKTKSTLSYTALTRQVTLSPTETEYEVYYKGRLIVIQTPLSITLSASSGGRYITLNPTSLELEDSGNTVSFSNSIVVAYVYYDATTQDAIIFGDERHSAARDTTWHQSKHNEDGMVWRSGGQVTYTLNNSNTVNLSFTDMTVADEDLVFNINHALTPNGYYEQILQTSQIPTLYLEGAFFTQAAPSVLPWIGGSNTAKYNSITDGNGALVDASDGNYINYWIVATNDMRAPIKAIVGRQQHTTLISAYGETLTALDLPFQEFVVMYQVTLQTKLTYTGNLSKVVIVSVRRISSVGDSTPETALNGFNHRGLSNLSSDDHLQYVHISNSRTITAAHTFNGVQTFVNGIKINTMPTVNVDGANKRYVDQQALLMAFLNS